MTIFNDLIKKASQFVEKQKGVWDHSKWEAFLSDIQKKGDELSDDMQDHLGVVLESMKKFYKDAAITGRKMRAEISDQVAELVEKTKGKWEHLDWEKFVADLQKKGIELTEDAKRDLGDILESAKKFYSSLPQDKVEKTAASASKRAKKPAPGKSKTAQAAKRKTPAASAKSRGSAAAKATKGAATKTAPAKKTAVEKGTAAKPAAKKTAVKKGTTAKPAAKKTATKKPASKK
jgi:hypothetical protein